MFQNLIGGFVGSSIKDIRVPGFVSTEEDALRFYPHLESVYFWFDKGTLRFQSVQQYSKLQISIAPNVVYDFEIDEDDRYGWCSAMDFIVHEQGVAPKLTSLGCFLTGGADISAGLMDAVEICLSEGTRLFLDPMNTFGVRLGNQNDRKEWEVERHRSGKKIELIVFPL